MAQTSCKLGEAKTEPTDTIRLQDIIQKIASIDKLEDEI